MSRNIHYKSHLDTTPPEYNGPLSPLDKSSFQKSIPILAVRVPASQTATVLNSDITRQYLIGIPKIRPVVRNPSDPDGDRLVLLKIKSQAEIPPGPLKFLESKSNGFVDYVLNLDYDYWTASEILQAVLPETLREGAPVGFATTGHVAHMNLNDEYLPYKKTIGQIFLDKNKLIKTVVNKLDNIDTQFRVFDMEVLAGEPNFIVEHHESDCRFTFDFSQVYWNSRLHTEHDRIVNLLKPGEVLADVFAGVGPFAIPAAKNKSCAVLANDLNPQSSKYLSKNAQDNEVSDLVRVSCEDGRTFIRDAFHEVYNSPFPSFTGPKPSKTLARKLQKQARNAVATTPASDSEPLLPRKTINHFVMNLPDTAILFLDAFKGVITSQEMKDAYEGKMPLVHCHCFTRELEQHNAEVDIRKRVEEKLGHAPKECNIMHVRSVAPNKEMYCISFRLLPEIVFA
ncbi:tRNA(m(1)G37)methyltransferase [Stygiomarasmius scandens]|uniref:tRNA (guanine(37)-N1)-methyltransferase n=1 Tax=Marasmiellus scandens TaxID=2682957 RepID=A0ABR1JT13_9AGAR